MRKLFVILTAVVALTVASKAMLAVAEEMAPEAMTDTMSNEAMDEMNAMNDMNAMGNEMMEEGVGNTNTY